jgi:MoaA/NifB/PqqE/SkfB family radical SAM enzyme
VLWRGPLDSCNYACGYCPFAKRPPSPAVMRADREALDRFVGWIHGATAWRFELLFTPYGEALIQPWYREALVRISRLEHVRSAAIQTNGSAPMEFLDRADRARLALWVSWHPGEVARDAFVAKMTALHGAGTRLCVGAVAVPDRIEEIEALRRELPAGIPMWINAQKPGVRYDAAAVERWSRIDPHFGLETRAHRTGGRVCLTGEEVISVDGAGDVRRCHFVDERLGNLYRDDLAALLRPRPCPRQRCACWIGYAHLADLRLRDAFGEGDFLARLRRPR